MNDEKELKDFLMLCSNFIKAEKEISKNDGYVNKSDLNYLYRFICHNGWETLRDWRDKRLIKRLFE